LDAAESLLVCAKSEQTDFTEDLKKMTLKTYKGFPHGMPTTEAETINADLLAFLQS
jgi:hypothetical protein